MHPLLVISIALAIGCRDEGLTRLEDVRTTVCKCKTATCAEAAIKLVPPAVKSNARSQRIARDMLDCLAKLYAKERPTTGPDEAPPPSEPPSPTTPPAPLSPAATP